MSFPAGAMERAHAEAIAARKRQLPHAAPGGKGFADHGVTA